MNKITKVALVLLAFALLLGVGGGLLGENERTANQEPTLTAVVVGDSSTSWFGCPDHDPNCQPGKP